MKVTQSNLKDFEGWLALAREVEPLFGPMADDELFRDAIRLSIRAGLAFCIRVGEGDSPALAGGVIISNVENEVAWLAVYQHHRGKGCGRALLASAIEHLNAAEPIMVQTFDETVPEGQAARELYDRFGFRYSHGGEKNPAGIPTVYMYRPSGQERCVAD